LKKKKGKEANCCHLSEEKCKEDNFPTSKKDSKSKKASMSKSASTMPPPVVILAS